MTSTRTILATALAATAAVAATIAPTASAATLPTSAPATAVEAPRPGLRSVLQRDADALVVQGAPGVLADVRTPRGTVKVRAGFADTSTGRPVAWNTRFRVGSLTKPFVSTAVLQLVGQGRLSLGDTVEEWLPGLVRGHGNDGRRITVRQLLQHTSGLPEYLQGYPWLFSQEGFEAHRFDTVTPRQAVRTAMQHPPEFAPGTSWSYSNTNYQLAGMIITKVTGRPWQQAVRRGILRPLHLDQTVLPGTRAGLPRPHAVGYERFPGPDATPEDPQYGAPIDATRQNPSWGGAAGEIISTTRDTNRFLRALVTGRLLRPAQQRALMRTVPVDAGFAQNWPGARYGLGLLRTPVSCGVSWAHGGDIMGFQTRNGILENGRRSVMITMNTDSFVPEPGAPVVTEDKTNELIDHALCPR